MTVRLQREDFDIGAEIVALTQGRTDIGAVATFTGICRGTMAIAAMTLEHYPGMAEAEIARHVEEAQARWPLLGVTVIHRHGRLVPGDNIVLVVTASSHREAAFAAAEFLMDYLKTQRAVLEKRGTRGRRRLGRSRHEADRCSDRRALERPGGRRRPPNSMPKTATGEKPARESGGDDHDPPDCRDLRGLAICPAALADTVAYFPVTSGAHPHDVAAAPDGTVWYTAQSQGALGILDPKTGKVEQISLGKGAAPHGVIVGPDGAAWITEGGQNAIARFDPKSKAVKLFPLPKGFERTPTSTPRPSTRTARSGSPGRAASMAASIRRAARSRPGRRRRATALTASPRRRRARSGTPRSRAITSRASTPRPAPRPWSSRRSRASARAASGRIPRAFCG